MFSKQKYHKKCAKFLDSESSWKDLMFFVYVLSGTALDYHLYMYITTLHVGLFLPRLSLQDSVSLDVFSKESCILNLVYDISIFLPSIFIVFAFQSFFSRFAFCTEIFASLQSLLQWTVSHRFSLILMNSFLLLLLLLYYSSPARDNKSLANDSIL